MSNPRSQSDVQGQTILQAEFSLIDSRLKALSELDARIGLAIVRLVNPKPAAEGKGCPPTVSPSTVESQLHSIVCELDRIIDGLRDHAGTLDSAI